MGIIISTDRLISTSEARKQMAKLLDDIQTNEKHYYVILENGKVAALLVHPHWLSGQAGEDFPSLESVRKEWIRSTGHISEALEKLEMTERKKLPLLLR